MVRSCREKVCATTATAAVDTSGRLKRYNSETPRQRNLSGRAVLTIFVRFFTPAGARRSCAAATGASDRHAACQRAPGGHPGARAARRQGVETKSAAV